MKDVSAIRILLMRAMYVVLFLGLAINVWPSIAHHRADLPRMNGVVLAVMGGIGLVSVLGIRHPVRMIPLLLFELTWKSIWLVAFALPRYLDHTLDAGMRSTSFDTSLGLVLLFVIPWRHVWAEYLVGPSEPWRLPKLAKTATRSSIAT